MGSGLVCGSLTQENSAVDSEETREGISCHGRGWDGDIRQHCWSGGRGQRVQVLWCWLSGQAQGRRGGGVLQFFPAEESWE